MHEATFNQCCRLQDDARQFASLASSLYAAGLLDGDIVTRADKLVLRLAQRRNELREAWSQQLQEAHNA